ncbi:MAG: inorganic phosphate transporter [Promethearchaeota archaeon]
MALATIIIIFLVISVIIAVAIGANDETMAPIYGSRILTMKQILILAVILAIAGAILLGEGVADTVGNDLLLVDITYAIVITILISTAIWLILSSALGLPISTTHATIGAIIGIGILLGGIAGLNWITITGMVIWWILSPIVGYFGTYYTYKLFQKYKREKLKGFQDYQRSENIFAYIILIAICITAFSRAGNDCSNAVGIVVGVGDIPIGPLLIFTGVSLAAGIVLLGRIVIKNLGGLTELRPSTAFAAQAPTAFIMLIGTIQKIPLSGSHMLVASLVGLAKASRTPMEKGLWKIVAIWFLTFPMSAILAMILYFPISGFF